MSELITIEDITFDLEKRSVASEIVTDSFGVRPNYSEYDAFVNSECHRVIGAIANQICLVGALGYRLPNNEHSLVIERLAVAKAYRRHGIGEKLITRAEQIAAGLGRSTLDLTATNNSLQYYLNRQFVPVNADNKYELTRPVDLKTLNQ